jgi:hypothetical protein
MNLKKGVLYMVKKLLLFVAAALSAIVIPSLAAMASSAEEGRMSDFFLKLSVSFAGLEKMSQFVEEIGMPDRNFSPSPGEVVYVWERTFSEENNLRIGISATESGSKVVDKSVSAFFSDPGEEGHDYERAGKFFVEVCRDYERTLKHVSKVAGGGGYGWIVYNALYPLNEDFYLFITLFEDDEGTAETIFKVVTAVEASRKVIRCASDQTEPPPALYAEPDTAAAVVEGVELGMEFYILETRESGGAGHPWYLVRSTAGPVREGWVSGEYMQPLEETTLEQTELLLQGANE